MDRLFELDTRIETEYKAFEDVQGRSDEVDALVEKKLVDRLGPNYGLMKAATKELYREIYKEARELVYGEDYHPSLFTHRKRR